jgi:hypothetical protein
MAEKSTTPKGGVRGGSTQKPASPANSASDLVPDATGKWTTFNDTLKLRLEGKDTNEIAYILSKPISEIDNHLEAAARLGIKFPPPANNNGAGNQGTTAQKPVGSEPANNSPHPAAAKPNSNGGTLTSQSIYRFGNAKTTREEKIEGFSPAMRARFEQLEGIHGRLIPIKYFKGGFFLKKLIPGKKEYQHIGVLHPDGTFISRERSKAKPAKRPPAPTRKPAASPVQMSISQTSVALKLRQREVYQKVIGLAGKGLDPSQIGVRLGLPLSIVQMHMNDAMNHGLEIHDGQWVESEEEEKAGEEVRMPPAAVQSKWIKLLEMISENERADRKMKAEPELMKTIKTHFHVSAGALLGHILKMRAIGDKPLELERGARPAMTATDSAIRLDGIIMPTRSDIFALFGEARKKKLIADLSETLIAGVSLKGLEAPPYLRLYNTVIIRSDLSFMKAPQLQAFNTQIFDSDLSHMAMGGASIMSSRIQFCRAEGMTMPDSEIFDSVFADVAMQSADLTDAKVEHSEMPAL